jgi:hypothetical protein
LHPGRIRAGAERIAHQRRGDAPFSDRASGIAGEHFAKCPLALAEPERVQQRNAALEARLHGGLARARE